MEISLSHFLNFAGSDINIWKSLEGKASVIHNKFRAGTISEVSTSLKNSIFIRITFEESFEGKKERTFQNTAFTNQYFEALFVNDPEFNHLWDKYYRPIQTRKDRKERERSDESKIAEFLSEYRTGEVNKITPEDVSKWADQFPYQKEEHRAVVLSETLRILQKYYPLQQAKSDIESFFCAVEDYWREKGQDPIFGIRNTNFIDVNQPYGSSQKHMLHLLDEASLEKYGVHLEECGGSKVYVYIDDCLYSGERLINEIDGFSKKENRIGELLIWYPVMHKTGLDHACKKLGPMLSRHQISWRFFNRKKIINNQRTPCSQVEGFWPIQKERCERPEVEKYIQDIIKKDQTPNGFSRITRPKTVPAAETIFSSPEAREIIEDLFLTVGVQAINSLQAPVKIRPLGFDHLNTLGFGSMFISYRNIANNCPIAFWLQSQDKKFPWTPLLKRKRNREGDIWS